MSLPALSVGHMGDVAAGRSLSHMQVLICRKINTVYVKQPFGAASELRMCNVERVGGDGGLSSC